MASRPIRFSPTATGADPYRAGAEVSPADPIPSPITTSPFVPPGWLLKSSKANALSVVPYVLLTRTK